MRMNNKFFIILAICALLSSCGFGGGDTSSSSKSDGIEANNDSSDSIKEQLMAQDSLANGQNFIIDSLTNEFINTKQEVSNMQSKISGLHKPSIVLYILCIISILLSIISIILLFRKTKRMVDSMEVSDIFNSKFKSLDLPSNLSLRLIRLEQESKISSNSDQNSHSSMAMIESIVRRLEKLESAYNNREKRNPVYVLGDDSAKEIAKHVENDNYGKGNDSSTKKTSVRFLYTGINSENYFVDFYNSQQESCVYKIICETEDKGDFTLISLDKIQSSNGWRTVVDYETNGDCTIEDAHNFTIIDYGKCEKIEDNTWKVTKNLKIKISK